MRHFALLFLSACLSCFAQSSPYQSEPLVFEHYDTTIHMHADGTGDRIVHVAARLQSEGAVRQFTVISVPYASSYETGTIDYIRVHKADGTTLETPVADAIEMPSQVTRIAPLYSDLKEKQLPVRSLAAGDVIEYQLRVIRTGAEAPGQFWGSEHFVNDAAVVLSQTLTLEVPAEKYVQVWDPNHPTTPKQHDGLRTYTWTTAQLKPTGTAKDAQPPADKIKDPDEDSEGRKVPSVAWTTFHNWAEVGALYSNLAHGRSDPTPAIVTEANNLTRNAVTPEEQIRALYDYVSTKIRYVGIDFGIGRMQPHAAPEVMAYQYGDCKDKSTLLESLLRAKGFTTAPALIGVGIAPVPDVPSPALFNHVITTVNLPSGRIWLDSTPEVAPYRLLIPLLRDQQALVIPATGSASLERTPADPPFPYFERFEAVGTLDKDGLLKSHMDLTLRSDNELGFRVLLQQSAPAQWNESMQSVSRMLGFAGTVSNTNFRQTDPAGPVHLSYDYNRPSFADWDNRRILPLFPSLEIAYIDRDKAPDHDIDQGAPRKLEAITRIKLPDGFDPDLPTDVHVKRDYATFDQTYAFDKGELVITRTTVILKKKVPKADWKDYYAYTKALGAESGESYITLSAPSTSRPAVSAAITQAGMEMRQGNLDAARQTLNEAKAKDPSTPYLMAMLAYFAQRDGKPDEAIHDYELELVNQPQAPTGIINELAALYLSRKRPKDAATLLSKYLDRKDVTVYTVLARAQSVSGDDAGAVATLQSASLQFPENASVQSALAKALHRTHHDEQAVPLLKKMLSQSNDPNVLNTNAYLFAGMKLELPLAEATSRRAIEILETASTQVMIQKVDDQAYGKTNLLAATWDTLGWILFLQGKPAAAEPYLRAAWVSRPELIVGDHLAQVLDALGKSSEALKINELAFASAGSIDIEETAEVKQNIDRLRHAGVSGSVHDPTEALQQMRTFHILKPPAMAGSATFRLAIVGDRVKENVFVRGTTGLEELGAKLNQLRVPNASPAGSTAHLFRDAILYCSSGTTTCEFVLVPHEIRPQTAPN